MKEWKSVELLVFGKIRFIFIDIGTWLFGIQIIRYNEKDITIAIPIGCLCLYIDLFKEAEK